MKWEKMEIYLGQELHVSANYKEMLEGYKQSSIKNKANNEAC